MAIDIGDVAGLELQVEGQFLSELEVEGVGLELCGRQLRYTGQVLSLHDLGAR